MKPRFDMISSLAIACVWLLFFMVKTPLANAVTARYQSVILAAARGNVSNSVIFVENRLRDGALLFTAALVGAMIYRFAATRFLICRTRRLRGLLFSALVGFGLVNAWLLLSMHTTLFWCLMWQGESTE